MLLNFIVGMRTGAWMSKNTFFFYITKLRICLSELSSDLFPQPRGGVFRTHVSRVAPDGTLYGQSFCAPDNHSVTPFHRSVLICSKAKPLIERVLWVCEIILSFIVAIVHRFCDESVDVMWRVIALKLRISLNLAILDVL